MKPKRTHDLIAAVLLGALAFTSAHAQQVPIPHTAAEVRGPAPGPMTKAYVQMVGRMAYVWGWDLPEKPPSLSTGSRIPPRLPGRD